MQGSSVKGLQALALAFDGLGASLRGKNAVERKMYYSQLANILGVIDLPQTGEVMANRLGGMQTEDKSAMQLANFFTNRTNKRDNCTTSSIDARRYQFIVEQAKQYRPTTNAGMKKESRLALQDLGCGQNKWKRLLSTQATLQKREKAFTRSIK